MVRLFLSLTLFSLSFAVGDYGLAFAAESAATTETIPQLVHLAITLLGMLVAGGLAYQAFDRAIAVDDTLTSPRYMTSPQQYRLGGWVYVAFACLFFFLLVLEHRDVLELAEPFKIIPDGILAAAKAKSASYLAIVVAIGVVYLALLKLEAPWNVLLIPRNLIRTCISVPELVRQIKTKIQYALCVPGDEILKVVAAAGGTVVADDFGKDRSTAERKWAEICYMKEWLTRALGAAEDTPFFGEASFAFPTLMADFETAWGSMARRKAGTASDQERAGLAQTIDALHGRLSRLVACYLIYRNSSRMALSTQARKFGVEIGPKYINPLHYWIIYVGVLVASVYVGVYVSAVVYDVAAGHGVVFDQSAERALTWSLYSISNYGFALILVLLMRFFVIPSVQSHLATYCWTFFLALFSGPLGLTAAIHFFGPDPIANVPIGALYYGMLQWGIGPALVSVYISYYLDRQTFDDLPDIVHSLGTIPWRVLNALAFAVGTELLLLPALMGIVQQSDITWDLSKLRFVAAGSTFAVAFGLALAAQFALRKPKRRQ